MIQRPPTTTLTAPRFPHTTLFRASYALLSVLRNIGAGSDGVPPAVIEAADGMGYEPWRRFLVVDLRLATPAIIGGLRVATVTVIGMVTVAALAGSGGFGTIIAAGPRPARGVSPPLLLGAALSLAGRGVSALAFSVLH